MTLPQDRITEPEDNPASLIRCKKCGKRFPETKDYFETYTSRGLWYRRPQCKKCRRSQKDGTAKKLTKEQLERRGDGQLLLDIETRLRGVMYEIGKANPEYKVNAREFWITHLEKISQLTEEAMEMVSGEMLDDLLVQITGEGNGK